MEKKEAKEPVEGETMTMEVEKKQVSATKISFNFNVNLIFFLSRQTASFIALFV